MAPHDEPIPFPAPPAWRSPASIHLMLERAKIIIDIIEAARVASPDRDEAVRKAALNIVLEFGLCGHATPVNDPPLEARLHDLFALVAATPVVDLEAQLTDLLTQVPTTPPSGDR